MQLDLQMHCAKHHNGDGSPSLAVDGVDVGSTSSSTGQHADANLDLCETIQRTEAAAVGHGDATVVASAASAGAHASSTDTPSMPVSSASPPSQGGRSPSMAAAAVTPVYDTAAGVGGSTTRDGGTSTVSATVTATPG